MYFITALVCTAIAATLWFFFRDRKALHLDFLTIIYGAASLMWTIDVIFTAAEGEAPLTFEPLDGQIALWTVLGGLFLWMIISFIFNHKDKTVEAK